MKSKVLRCLALLAAVCLSISLAACGANEGSAGASSEATSSIAPQADMPKKDVVIETMTVEVVAGAADKSAKFNQLDAPQPGDTIVTIKIKDYGDVKIRLFKDKTPKAFENFTTHAKNGYYDGLKFHRVIENFMIQGGDPEGTGMGGESIWGEGFGIEIDENLHHYAGALAMAQSSMPNSIGSQFYIVTGEVYDETTLDQLVDQMGVSYTDAVKQQYMTIGGAPFLDTQYTVFGQVYEGYDIVEKISKVDTFTQEDAYYAMY